MPGGYFSNPSGLGLNDTISEVTAHVNDGDAELKDSVAIGVSIKENGEPSVPGPAAALSMALGFAGAALRRRRSR